MKKKQTLKPAKEITPLDLAKILGQEKEYREALFEVQMKKNFEEVMRPIDDNEEKEGFKSEP